VSARVSWAATVASCVLIVAWGLGYHVPEGLLLAVAIVAAVAQRVRRRVVYVELRRDRNPE
jgi:H+/Cl- antiporter ClcA